MAGMIFLYTDFGLEGPYVGQMRAAIARCVPGTSVVDLCHDLAPFDARAAAYLLAALAPELPRGCAVVGVVDPGVGTDRDAVVLEADGRYYVGPDNGLFAIVAHHAAQSQWRRLAWRPEGISNSFHGRDLFAPAAARLLAGIAPETTPIAGDPVGADWPDTHAAIIYIDHYGNAMTGVPARDLPRAASITVAGRYLQYAPTFGAVEPGEAFWYENSNGLVEIAVNRGRADTSLDLEVGSVVEAG